MSRKTQLSVNCGHGAELKCPTCAPDLWYPPPGTARAFTISYLVDQIGKARLAYEAGAPIMRDEEFDQLEGSLRAYDPDNPVLHRVGTGQGEKE